MIFSPHPARIQCDHTEPVESEALGKKAPRAGCSRGITARLVLTVNGTWIPVQLPEGWQLLVIHGSPHSLFGVRCPEHRKAIAPKEKPSGLVLP